MTTEDTSISTRERVGVVGATLAYVVAAIHLIHPKLGMPRLILLASTGNLSLLVNHPRPLVFVLSGLAIVVGVSLAIWGYRRRELLALGIVLMLVYIVGYFAWHFSGHGGFLPGREPLLHGLSPLENVAQHLTGDAYALASKAAEVALLVILVYLYREESRRDAESE